jgi:hypothetical protein
MAGFDFTREGWLWPSETHGVMECWSNGILTLKSGPPQADYFPSYAIHIKTVLIPPNPILQHSTTPILHGIHLRHSQFTLAWTKGPGIRKY